MVHKIMLFRSNQLPGNNIHFNCLHLNLMEAIPLCDKIEVYIFIICLYTTTATTTLISVWQHVSAAHADIFRPA